MGELPQEPKPVQRDTSSWSLISVYFSFGLGLFLGELSFYGWSLFVIFPLIVGLCAGLMRSKKYKKFGVYIGLAAFLALLLVGHYESFACVIYAIPLALFLMVVGHILGYIVAKRKRVDPNRLNLLVYPLLLVGFATFLDHLFGYSYQEETISTSLFLPYSPEKVFDEIKSVDTLDTDKPFFMMLGLPVPQKCVLESDTVGAKRTCYFEGGIIEEKVTEIKRGEVLKMEVTKYTLPGIKWLKFKDAEYYFRPQKNGTVITRVTTYYSSLKPRFYWRWCERSAIESEHDYVLSNLKKDLENKYGPVAADQDTLKRIRINDDLEIVPLSKNTYMHVSWVTMAPYGRFSDNGLIYVNDKEAVFMDTPMNDSVSNILLDWFEKNFPGVRIKGIIVNHFHDDCLGGLRAFHKKGIVSYANYMTNESIKNDSTERPQKTFTDEMRLRVGKNILINRYLGPAHAPDNIVTWIPGEKILFGGCMVKALGANRGNLSDANLKEWSATISKVKRTYPDAKIVIPGHGDQGGIALLDYTIKMFENDAK